MTTFTSEDREAVEKSSGATLTTIARCAACVAATLAAYHLANNGKEGWGWFVFIECSDCRSSSRKHYVSGSNDCPLFYEEVRNDWEKRV